LRARPFFSSAGEKPQEWRAAECAFLRPGAQVEAVPALESKSFLVLFFKKELLPSYPLLKPRAECGILTAQRVR
jgi:hypothetical protein